MKAERTITIWQFNEDSQTFVKCVFKNAHLHIRRKVAKSGIKEKGFHLSSTTVVRIPTRDNIDVACGDYITCGEHHGCEPDYSDAFKVTEICDNRRGYSPHWKISCGGER